MHPKEILEEKIRNLPEFEKRKIYLENGKKIKKFVAICEAGRDRVISVVSRKYTLVQFRDVFLPILESIDEDVCGKIFYYNGRAYLMIFPKSLGNIGILIRNSVDRSVAITFEFIIDLDFGNLVLAFDDIKKFKRKHMGNVLTEVRSITKLLVNIKEIWKNIVEKLGKIELDEKYANDILKLCKLGKTARRAIINKLFSRKLNGSEKSAKLWDLVVEVVKMIGRGKYKSEVHRIDKIRQVSKVLIGIAVAEEI